MSNKKTTAQAQNLHPLTSRYPSNSLYNWRAFNRKKLAIRQQIILGIIEDYITLYDMFWVLNDFINYRNKSKDFQFEVEHELNGLNQIFVVGMIEDQHDKDYLYEVMTSTIHSTKDVSKTVKERARIVETLLRAEILNRICLN